MQTKMTYLIKVTWPLGILCLYHLLTTCSSEPAFPDVDGLLRRSYQTHVEYTQHSKNESQFLTEFHDRAQRKGYIKRLAQDDLTHDYYFQDTDEFVRMTNTWCNVSKLSDQQNDDNFQQGGIQYAFASSVLKQLPKTMAYKGEGMVRGIRTTHFQGIQDGVTYDAYFREGKWRGADNDTTHIPIRVVVQTPAENETEFYDFHRFRRYIQQYSDMNLKTGIGCKGKKNPPSTVLPSIPSQVSFEYEIFDYSFDGTISPDEQLELNTVWYDSAQKIARVDLTSSDGKTTTEIHDFNSGVMYEKANSRCTMKHVRSSKFTYTKQDRAILLMKTPDQLLGLGDNLYYVGKDKMRGAMCDIWESVEENAVIRGQRFTRVVSTFYITTLQWLSTLGGSEDAFIPLRKTAWAYENSDDMRMPDTGVAYNIFDYAEQSHYDPAFYKNFDISDCFEGADTRTYFEIFLKSDSNVSQAVLQERRSVIRKVAMEQIYTLADISPLRLSRVYMSTKENNSVQIVVLLLAHPPALASFIEADMDEYPRRNMKKVPYMPSQEDCARKCIPDTDCMLFLYRDHVCYFASSVNPKSWGEVVTQELYQKFIKADVNITTVYQSNKDVIKKVKSEVESGNFIVKFPKQSSADAGPISLRAIRFVADASPFGERIRDKPYELIMKDKTLSLKPVTAMKAKPLGTTKQIASVQQCYRACIKESGISCASFSYCSATTECRLSSEIVESSGESRSSVTDDTRCKVYMRSYLNFFKKFPGSVVQVGGDVSIPGVKTPASCAKECKHNKDLRCRGFEFCENSNVCILHEAHFLDINPYDIVNNSDSCSHYAAKFIADYWEVGMGTLEDPNARVVELVSVEDCAKQCSLDPSGLCKSFNYCPGKDGPTAKCSLNTISVLDDGAQLRNTEDCYHYYQQDGVHDFVTRGGYRAAPMVQLPVASGALGGLLFAMLLVGMIAGVGGLFGFTYWKARRAPNDGGAVHFVAHVDE